MFAELTRRDFLKKTGILTTALALSGCGGRRTEERLVPYLRTPENQLAGVFTEYASTCADCGAGCGIIVRTMGGRAHKIEGNPRHPVNQGALCARGQSGLQALYNPDRLQGPQQREGDRWSSISWDEAATRLGEAVQGAGGGVAAYGGRVSDHLYRVASLFLEGAGADPPVVWSLSRAAAGENLLLALSEEMFGERRLPVFDVGAAEVVFSFGAGFLESWLSPVFYARGYGQMRRRDQSRGFVLQVEPRLSLTGANADQWLAVPAGREGEMALVFGRIILDERLESPDAPEGVQQVFADVPARQLTTEMGLPWDTVVQLARRFGAARSALALPGGGLTGQANAEGALGAVMALNLLVAAHTQALRLSPPPPDTSLEPVEVVSSFGEVRQLVERMQNAEVQVLLVLDGSPAHDLPGALGFRQALEQVPLVVDFSPFPTDTSARSHLHLPGPTYLEAWGYRIPHPGTSLPTVSSQQPVVPPLWNTRSTVDVLLAAARAAGGDVGGRLTWENEAALLREAVAPLAGAPTGSIVTDDEDAFFARFQQFGGWWATDSEPEAAEAPSVPANIDAQLPQGRQDSERRYLLQVFPHLLLDDGRGANRPWLQEVPEPMTSVMWESWIEVGPQLARELELEKGDIVEVSSGSATLRVPVFVHPGLPPDMVAMPLGQGHTAYGRYAAGRGVNAADLLELGEVGDTGELAFAETRVSVEKTGDSTRLCRLEGSDSTTMPTGVW
jgi:anaerobic selenocysteine-containing dehydrogenase